MPYLVQKPLPAGEVTFQPGMVVEADGWRNLNALIAGRYLTLVEEAPAPAKKQAKAKPTSIRSTSTVKVHHVGTD